MKTFIRLFQLGIFLVAQAFFITESLAAETVHLHLKDAKGKTYKCKTEAGGKFSFDNVEPGKYELIWVLPDGTTPDNTESCAIEIESFSWGASQLSHHGSTTSSNQRTGDLPAPAAQAPRTPREPPRSGSQDNGQSNKTINTSRSNIKSQRSASEFKSSGGKYYVVVMEDVIISGVTTCEGSYSRMAINEKGVPGKKSHK